MSQPRSASTFLALALMASPAGAAVDPATLKHTSSVLGELDFKPPRPPGLPIPISALGAFSLNYNGTIVDGPFWDRPIGCGPNISGLGPVRHHVQPFTVTTDGLYQISSLQTFDGYLHVYSELFEPEAGRQTANCVDGNDDGQGGVGTSGISGLSLVAGRQYFVVTSGFRAADRGTFTNTISGVGEPILGSGGADVSVTITPSVTTAQVGETYRYDVKVTNQGPGVATQVTLELEASADQTVNSNTCQQFPLSTLAAGASVSCAVVVTLTGCGSASLLGTVDADGVDNPSNNLELSRVNQNLVADEGFEAGSPSPTWVEASTIFGTPLCTAGTCGTGTGSLPRSGNWWAWFGGAIGPEEGRLSQSVVLPQGGTAVLEFFFEMAVCSGSALDYFEVTLDGEQIYHTDGLADRCGTLGYRLQRVDISAYADGQAHLLEFHSALGSGENTNFFVNDVAIASCTTGGAPGVDPPAIPTLGGFGLLALVVLLALAATVVLGRRRREA